MIPLRVDFSDLQKIFRKFEKVAKFLKHKIIDWECKGNVVRLYLGRPKLKDWWGDDWDDRPYEHNAGRVYDEFISGYIDIAFSFDCEVDEPCEGVDNSQYCKDSFKCGETPIIKGTIHFYMQETLEQILARVQTTHGKLHVIACKQLRKKRV